MAKELSLVAPGTPAAQHLDMSDYVSFAEAVRHHIGSMDIGDIAKHVDGIGARNLTSDPEIIRHVLRFVGDYTDPDRMLIHEADVPEFVRRYKKHERQSD